MTIPEFIKTAEDFVYKEIAKNTNLLLGKTKTAGLSTGLFLKLPVKVTIEQTNAPLPKLDKELKTFMNYFGAYVEMGNHVEVHFKFLYHNETELKTIARHMERHGVFFAFVYMHELQHIIRKHITSGYNTMMLRIADGLQDPHQVVNIAEDYAINYSIKDLFMASQLKSHWSTIEPIGLYNAQYHKDQLSDIEILKLLKEGAEQPKVTQVSNCMSKVEFDGKETTQPTNPGGNEGDATDEDGGKSAKTKATDTSVDDLDTAMSDLSEAIQDVIQTNTKGTTAGKLMNSLFGSIKVETGWFKKIKASFKRQVYYMTHDYSTNWANLNNTYRRIYKAPKKQFFDTKLELVLSVDHSGSVSTEALQRLLYLMEDVSKQITKLTVLIHDTRIVKEFVLESDYDIAENKQFKEALATRFVVGGTSHSDVFDWIDNNVKDLNKTIFLSYSDNYSDIPQEWAKHPRLRNLSTFFVCCENNPMKVKGTTDILMV